MRFWFHSGWYYVCLVGLLLIIAAGAGVTPKETMRKIAARILVVICGLAIILFGIWMNARWLIH